MGGVRKKIRFLKFYFGRFMIREGGVQNVYKVPKFMKVYQKGTLKSIQTLTLMKIYPQNKTRMESDQSGFS